MALMTPTTRHPGWPGPASTHGGPRSFRSRMTPSNHAVPHRYCPCHRRVVVVAVACRAVPSLAISQPKLPKVSLAKALAQCFGGVQHDRRGQHQHHLRREAPGGSGSRWLASVTSTATGFRTLRSALKLVEASRSLRPAPDTSGCFLERREYHCTR